LHPCCIHTHSILCTCTHTCSILHTCIHAHWPPYNTYSDSLTNVNNTTTFAKNIPCGPVFQRNVKIISVGAAEGYKAHQWLF
jgi:hypothetical protein